MKYRKKSKVLLVPYPAQGHVTPMLKLASLLANHGLNPIVIIPNFIKIDSKDVNITIMSINSDGLDETSPRDFFAIENAMENYMPCQFERLVRVLQDGDQEDGIVCLIVDLLASWAVEVANKCGIQVSGFWPAMLATYRLIHSIPNMLHAGIISETGCPLHHGPICLSLDQPTISSQDLPWLIGNSNARISRFKFWTRTMERTRTLKWLLINTFQDECHKDQNMTNFNTTQILPIGPLNTHVTIKNSSFWEEDSSCMNWLDKQDDSSVLYISFGSWVSPIDEAKVNSLALALEATKRPFIWVLGPSWRQGLQKGCLDRISKQGRIVTWAPQVDVLQHAAVGCYLTHCGWNSTMEAIQSKKRLLCHPIAGDQFVNCAYIVQNWRIGVRVNGLGVKDLEGGLRKVMEDNGMSERIDRLNEMTMGKVASCKAVDNLTTFLSDIRM
ncbi:unnamed protein product [Withania somnifera]